MEHSVHPAVEHARAIIANLPTKTGRSIIALVTVAEVDDQVELWLRTAYELDS